MRFSRTTFALPILFIVLSVLGLQAQQDAQYTQYMYNTISVNPAYAGNRDILSVVGLHRSQWVGLEGAPRTQTLSVHSPIGFSGKLGLGGSVVKDEIGPSSDTQVTADASYGIFLGNDSKLSFGLKLGANFSSFDNGGLNYDRGDVLINTLDGKINPTVGAGVYYNTDRSYVGLSVPNFLNLDQFDSEVLSTVTERMHLYFIAGHVFDLTSDVKFKPALLTKLVMGSPLQLDASANFLLFDKLTLGGAYRLGAAFSGLVGYQITESLMIGLAYDKETTELGNTDFNDGSYEVTLRFELFKAYSRITTPRFF